MSSRWSSVFLALLVAAAAASGYAAEPEDARSPSAGSRIHDEAARLWTVRMANDAFAFVDRDRDYTAGFAFALNGEQARRHWLSPLRVLDWVDDTTGFSAARRGSRPRAEGFELGLLLFTPQDLSAEQPLYDDRPYANLLYVAGVEAHARRGARRGISVVALARVPRVARRRAGAHRRPRAQRQQGAARLRSSDLGGRRANVHVRSVPLSLARERHCRRAPSVFRARRVRRQHRLHYGGQRGDRFSHGCGHGGSRRLRRRTMPGIRR